MTISSTIAAAALESTSTHPELNGAIARAATAVVAAAASTAATTTISVAAPKIRRPIQYVDKGALISWRQKMQYFTFILCHQDI